MKNENRDVAIPSDKQATPSDVELTAEMPVVTVPPATRIMLEKLQAKSPKIALELENSHRRLHKHLAQIYIWWREAREIDGYIDAEYAKLDPRKSSGKANPNFIPIIRIVWGANGNLKNQYAQRYGRALNAIHIEYEANPKHYSVGAIAKLTTFIKNEGGVSKLAGYVLAKKGPAEKHEVANERKRNSHQGEQAKTAEVNAARKAASAIDESSSIGNLDLPDYVPSDHQGFFLMLMNGDKVIARSHDQELIDKVLVDSHRERFEAHDSVTRPLLELTQTQCYPAHLKHMAKELADPNTLPEFKGQDRKSARRLMYLHKTDQFLLSPIRANSGVVSIITPDEPSLSKCNQDVFMPPYQRHILEQKLLQSFDFTLYNSGNADEIPSLDGENSASNAIRLRHSFDKSKRIDLHFWPFYDSFPQPLDQVGLNPEYKFEAQWEASLPHCYFQKLADQFLDPWLEGLGVHAKREKHRFLEVAFEERNMGIKFICNDKGELEGQELVELGGTAKCESPLTCRFLSKDWILALRSVAYLPVVGDVSLAVNDDVLRIAFSTLDDGGSAHEIHIPSIDADGNRTTEPFARYQPALVHDDRLDHVEPEESDLDGIETRLQEMEVAA